MNIHNKILDVTMSYYWCKQNDSGFHQQSMLSLEYFVRNYTTSHWLLGKRHADLSWFDHYNRRMLEAAWLVIQRRKEMKPTWKKHVYVWDFDVMKMWLWNLAANRFKSNGSAPNACRIRYCTDASQPKNLNLQTHRETSDILYIYIHHW